jgi:signal transduction histidine kinase
MLSRLRRELTAVYILAAIALIALIGGSAYRLLAYYFVSSTDQALSYRVALQVEQLGIAPSSELENASLEWENNHRPGGVPTKPSEENGSDEQSEDSTPESAEIVAAYDSELSSIFLLPVDPQGNLIFNPNLYTLPMQPDVQAVQAALRTGSDWRTVHLADGSRVRLFSYALPGESNLAVIQAGRSMTDQDRILNQLMTGLLLLGGASIIAVGAGSWLLAGRSLRPAQLAWDRQQSFVANASHELRAPLTLLRASAEVAQRSLPDGEVRDNLLGDILYETDHMSQLVDDLLLLSRLDAGRLELEISPISLADLLGELGRQTGYLAEKQKVRLETIPASLWVSGDAMRLRQVLLILIDNALHHTPPGGQIRVEARAADKWAQITVTDNGSGIAPEHLPHVFERFYRANRTRGQRGGSGLGLSIARALVEAQHGQISITSQPGKGVQATVLIPVTSKPN